MWPKIGLINTYGIFYFSGMVLHFFISCYWARHLGLKRRVWVGVSVCYLLGMIPGAKFLFHWRCVGFDPFVIFRPADYIQGGLWGGLLAYLCLAVPIAWFLSRKRRAALDLVGLTLPIPWALAKLGCFCHSCCHGKPSTLAWAVTFPADSKFAPGGVPIHPTQLYEVLVMILLFVLFLWLNNERWRGTLLFWFISVYGVSRAALDMFRGDADLYAVRIGAGTLTQLICLAAALLSLGILVYIKALNNARSLDSRQNLTC